MWTVVYLPEAEQERSALPARERAALINADLKLAAFGSQLGYPHSSAVQSVTDLRELRPRGGRSSWRALYRQVGDVFVVAAVCPEAQVDPRRFQRACEKAVDRLTDVKED
ncbi:MAG: type II toxin-antitoxin system RelE/ParE family toxin [Pseudonocardia sp.]